MDISKIKVSVVTPCFDNSKYIKETILSILNQTHNNLEIIVVDDFSDDDSVSIIKSIIDPRIILIENNENKGAAYCRNTAIGKASGDYIAFLDGDDLWAPDKLEKQLKFMVDNDYKFLCSKYEEIDENNNSLGRVIGAPKRITHKMFLRSAYAGCLTIIYKRDVYPDLSIPDDIKKRNDYALWIKLSTKVDCYCLDENLAKYRRRTQSISSGKKYKLIKYHKVMFMKVCGFSSFKAGWYSLLNILFFYIRKIRYSKRIKS